MAESLYSVIELVGTSSESWEKAADAALACAAKNLSDLRIAQIVQFDMLLRDGRVETYRARLRLSFAASDTWREQRAIRSRLQSTDSVELAD